MNKPCNKSTICISDIALEESLKLLEWPTLCIHLSTFAMTKQGRLRCKNFSLPNDISYTQHFLDETLEMQYLDELLEGTLTFQGINDLEEILLRCSKGGIASGEELLKVAETLGEARQLRKQIYDSDSRPTLTELLEDLSTLPELEKLLKFGLEEGGRVADRVSARLAGIRHKCKDLRLERRDVIQELIRGNLSILQDTVITDRNGRPVLSVKAGSVARIPGVVHDSSASGNTVFVEPQIIISIGNQITELEGYIAEEEKIWLAKWSSEVASSVSIIQHLCEVMLDLEFALTRARYGNWLGGVSPRLKKDDNSNFSVREFRHPLLVWKERKEGGHPVVPISFEVNSSLKVVAITGPNTGGKTVALKSIGLAVLMARAGLLLPCSERPCLPWCNQVLADIGDEQSLQQNLSTFSGHVKRISRILNSIEKSSGPTIVLLDEVGAGTDPTEGTALAIALLKTLADRARLTVATTHFGELKALKYTDKRFENASVAFDSESMAPTYHLQWGIPGRSNALLIASRLGFDDLIIERANELIGPKGLEDVNKVISGLEEQRKRQQEAAENAADLLVRTELLHEELLIRWQKQRAQSVESREIMRQKLEKSIREGQKEVRDLIRRLRQGGANGETARTVGQRFRQLENEYRPKVASKLRENWQPKLGETVRLLSLGKAAQIEGISDDGLQLTVRCGMFRSTVALIDVESLDGRKPSPIEPIVNVKMKATIGSGLSVRTSKNTVDVRGLRVHEAEVVVEEFLRTTAGPLWIIHGIGTGKLKRGLRNWLEGLAYVEKVVDADQKDGGGGCSVVWMFK